MQELLFIDIETTALTGPDAGQDAIIEIAASKLNLKTREVTVALDTLISPGIFGERNVILQDQIELDKGKPAWILGEYHAKSKHFENANFDDGMFLLKALFELQKALEGATIAGQNPHFDLRYLKRDFARYKLTFPKIDYHVIDLCSPAIFLHMNGVIPGVSLRHSGPWAGCTEQAHRAGQDVKDSIQVFWKMRDYFNPDLVRMTGRSI